MSRASRLLLILSLLAGLGGAAQAQATPPPVGEGCIASLRGHSAPVDADGNFSLANVPVDFGYSRVRIACPLPDGTTYAASGYFELKAGAMAEVGALQPGSVSPVPAKLVIEAPTTPLSAPGQSLQLGLTAHLSDGSAVPAAGAEQGTAWWSTDPAVASVDANGVVTAHLHGPVIIQAINEGVLTGIKLVVAIPDDSDQDGIPDAIELAAGLDPTDPSDAALDLDADGLTNLEEVAAGTAIDVADTDGDGIDDGQELLLGTLPLVADTDNDGLPDGQELGIGTDPKLADTDGDGIGDGQELALGTDPLHADATTTIEGTALLPDGSHISGVVASTAGQPPVLADDLGHFSLAAVPILDPPAAVVARVIVDGQEYRGAVTPSAMVSGGITATAPITMAPLAVGLTGVVHRPDGIPAGFILARVTIGDEVRVTETDAVGFFRFDNVPPGAVLVQATDPGTNLHAQQPVEMPPGQSLHVTLELTALSTISGVVFDETGLQTAGGGIPVTVTGPEDREVTTDWTGAFTVPFLPPGEYTLTAEGPDGQRALTTASLTGTDQSFAADLQWLGRGTVQGVVLSAEGQPIKDADVTAFTRTIFDTPMLETVSDAQGAFVFSPVFAGEITLTATLPVTQVGVSRTITLAGEGDVRTIDLVIGSPAHVTGHVYRHDQVTPVAGAPVRANSFSPVLTDAQGAFDLLAPQGSARIHATDPATDDSGYVDVVLASGQTLSGLDVVLDGRGTVRVWVRDFQGQPVHGASVAVHPALGAKVTAFERPDGSYLSGGVPAGPITVTAVDFKTGLKRTLNTALEDGEQAELTLSLPALARVEGHVVQADGTTPVPGVAVYRTGNVVAVTDLDGAFVFDDLPVALGPLHLVARDEALQILAEASDVALSAGQTTTVTLTLPATGVVTGTITDALGAVAEGVTVKVTSHGQILSGIAGLGGKYRIVGVPIGDVTVEAAKTLVGLTGSAAGTLLGADNPAVIDVQLSASPTPLQGASIVGHWADASGFDYAVRRDGSLLEGLRLPWLGEGSLTTHQGGAILFVRSGEVEQRFGDDPDPSVGPHGLTVSQIGLAGLTVTRRVDVPKAGYFARYLEVFENPGPAPITVGVRVDSYTQGSRSLGPKGLVAMPPALIGTSQVNGELGGATWLAQGSAEGDPFAESVEPVIAVVVGDGAAGDGVAPNLGFESVASGAYGHISLGIEALTVPANQRVALLHFVVQAPTRDAARAAAKRLAQLPPEALQGLDDADRAAVINFEVPPEAQGSAAVPLPPFGQSVTITTVDFDGTTPVPHCPVRLVSSSPIFAKTLRGVTGPDGTLVLNHALGDTTVSHVNARGPLPLLPFAVHARHGLSHAEVGPIAGSFDAGPLAALTVMFDAYGGVRGVARRPDGTVVSDAVVALQGPTDGDIHYINTAVDGSFAFGGVPPETYALILRLPSAQGTALTSEATASVAAGQWTERDLSLPPSGALTGVVTGGGGDPVVGWNVRTSQDDAFWRHTETDTGGGYDLVDLPVGAHHLRSLEPKTGRLWDTLVQIDEDQLTTQDIHFDGFGAVALTVTTPDGAPVLGARVQVRSPEIAASFAHMGETGPDGGLWVSPVPVGPADLRVYHAQNSQLMVTQSLVIGAHGEEQGMTVVLPVDTPPAVSLSAPVAGATVTAGATVAVAASATDDFGVVRMQVLVDGAVVKTVWGDAISEPVQILPAAAKSSVTVAVRAFDGALQHTDSAPVVVSVVQDQTPPSVSLLAPEAGASLVAGQPLTVRAAPADNVGLDTVTLTIGAPTLGALPPITLYPPDYRTTWWSPSDLADSGEVALTVSVVATDLSGLTSAPAQRVVTVSPDAPPAVSFAEAPSADLPVLAGSLIHVVGQASDDVSVSVEALVDGAVVATRYWPPFGFDLEVPSGQPSVTIALRAWDSGGQSAETAPLTLSIAANQAPTLSVLAPSDGAAVVEGATVTVRVAASDDVAVSAVRFASGEALHPDGQGDYVGQLMMPAGPAGEAVEVGLVAEDGAGLTGTATVSLTRVADTVPPAVSLSQPQDGAVLSLGPTDVVLVLDRSVSLAGSAGGDMDGDGIDETRFEAEVLAARALVATLNPETTAVGVVTFAHTPVLVSALSHDLAAVDSALAGLLQMETGGDAQAEPALELALDVLLGAGSTRAAAPVVLLMSGGYGGYPAAAVQRAVDSQVLVNSFGVGASAPSKNLVPVAVPTGGQFVSVTDPLVLAERLSVATALGYEAVVARAEASDDVGVASVTLRAHSSALGVDESQVDSEAPYLALFYPTAGAAPATMTVYATARDVAGGVGTDQVTVTVLATDHPPEIRALVPNKVAYGEHLVIEGRFFSGDAAQDEVRVGDVSLPIESASKTRIEVAIPPGLASGDLVVVAEGIETAPMALGMDQDHDGLNDEAEAPHQTLADNPDTDGDSLTDGFEVAWGFDPTDGDGAAAAADPDEDGLTTLEEQAAGTNPTAADTDGDGLSDWDEVKTLDTDPNRADSDGDGLPDAWEVAMGLDPTGHAFEGLFDPDSDGLDNHAEWTLGTLPLVADTDSDGLDDGAEVNTWQTDPTTAYSDAGCRTDGEEVLVDGTDPLDGADDLADATLPTQRTDGQGQVWRVDGAGRPGGEAPAVTDVGLALAVGIDEPTLTEAPEVAEAPAEDQCTELVFPAWTAGAVSVQRKVMVSAQAGFVRTVDRLSNPTGAPVSALVRLSVSPYAAAALTPESSLGTHALSAAMRWVVFDGPGLGARFGHVLSAPLAPVGLASAAVVSEKACPTCVSHDSLVYTFAVTVPAGGAVAVAHFDVRGESLAAARAAADGLLGLSPAVLWAQMTEAERGEVVNFGAATDSDGDGLSDVDELALGTDPEVADTDGDGLRDGFEVHFAFDPLGTQEGAADPDHDGLSNLAEQAAGTHPRDADSDNDDLSDGDEVLVWHSDPLVADTDGDSLGDGVEVAVYGSDPTLPDTDSDGLGDAVEALTTKTDPAAADTDGDGLPDGWEHDFGYSPKAPNDGAADPDGDGLGNLGEYAAGSDPHSPDTDDDGLLDGLEVAEGTAADQRDTDGGGRDDAGELRFDETSPVDGGDDLAAYPLPMSLPIDGGPASFEVRSSLAVGASDRMGYAGMALEVAGRPFGDYAEGRLETLGRQLAVGPWPMGGLWVSRRVYVPTSGAWYRSLVVLENPGAAPVETEVRLAVNTGTVLDNTPLSNAGHVVVTDDMAQYAGTRLCAHVFGDLAAPLQASDPTWDAPAARWYTVRYRVRVPSGQRVAIMAFGVLSDSQAEAEAVGTGLGALQGEALAGLSAADRAAVANFVVDATDTDGDGLRDRFEERWGLNVAGSDPPDADGDGADLAAEQAAGTDPTAADTDGDGLSDGDELSLGTAPGLADTDGDGLSDGEEADAGSSPLAVDSDGGGEWDGLEGLGGHDPSVPGDDGGDVEALPASRVDDHGRAWDATRDGLGLADPGARMRSSVVIEGAAVAVPGQARGDAAGLLVGPARASGLVLTRRMDVMGAGFTRILERLRNPAAVAVTRSVSLVWELPLRHLQTVVSSGDGAGLDAAADWAVVYDADGFGLARRMLRVFSSPGAPLEPAEVALTSFGGGRQRLTVRFEVAVPAGGEVALLHFERYSREVESLESLGQSLAALGGEALAGLSGAEQAAIVNMSAPAACGGAPDCDDADACTADSCEAGLCVHAAVVCNDGNLCTTDSCDPQSGCVATPKPLSTVCVGATLCKAAAHCAAWGCATGAARDCDDLNPCTVDACDLAEGCVHTPTDGVACDDGDACTVEGVCAQDYCVPGAPVLCDDGEVCTADACDPEVGCAFAPEAAGTPCGAATACQEAATCQFGSCVAGAAVDCDDQNPCTQDGCDAALGCTHQAVADGQSCGPTSLCETGSCQAGQCQLVPVDCDDGDVCTVETCDAGLGCQSGPAAAETPCGAATACQEAATCQLGSCVAGAAVDCDDQNPCTADGCDAALGCTHQPVVDGQVCAELGVCTVGLCQAGQCEVGPVDCDDQNPCTADSCVAGEGCVHPSVADGQACASQDVCFVGDTCVHGDCGLPISCHDGDSCTEDGCDPVEGCVFPTKPDGATCWDDSECTAPDTCLAGACEPGPAVSCDDNDPCTTDACDPVDGCHHSTAADGAACALTDPCSVGQCVSGACQTTPVDCADDNDCTHDGCSSAVGGCYHTPLFGDVCDDGDVCTDGDVCEDGVCLAGAPLNCSDDDGCTLDSCDPVAGCQHAPIASCQACGALAGPCGAGYVCAAGLCVSEAATGQPGDRVYVPGGTFQMGCDEATDMFCSFVASEQPQHAVTVSSFEIEVYEVTEADYEACVAAGDCEVAGAAGAPCHVGNDHPAHCVTWADAAAYCAWSGQRLCTEAEWEYAARGTDGRLYPWGDTLATCDEATLNLDGGLGCGTNATRPVGSAPLGRSFHGVEDMAGNVSEWTADWFDANYYATAPPLDPPGPAAGTKRSIRGSSYLDGPYDSRVSGRGSDLPTQSAVGRGIRCCATP